MRRHSITILLGIGVMSLSGCASHTYAPGPGMSAADFGPDAAGCRLFAEGTRPDTSFEAYGSPKAVAIEAGVEILIGGINTVVHDSAAYDNCMQSRGWLVADNAAAGARAAEPIVMAGAVPQQVRQSPLPPLSAGQVSAPPPPVNDEPAQRATRARRTADQWLVAQNILNGPRSRQQHGLYAALCDSGDLSACFMAGAR